MHVYNKSFDTSVMLYSTHIIAVRCCVWTTIKHGNTEQIICILFCIKTLVFLLHKSYLKHLQYSRINFVRADDARIFTLLVDLFLMVCTNVHLDVTPANM